MKPAPEELTLRSPAKINLLLRVLGKRDDGFHEIETVFQTISLHDRIVLAPSGSFSLSCSDPAIPTDSSNLVARAMERLAEEVELPSFSVHIDKSIPAGGGLGGGSSNAATVLRAMHQRYASEVPEQKLRELAAEIGSDVPFFLEGGTAYASGRGEKLRNLPSIGPLRLLLLFPEEKVATGEAYALLGRGPLQADAHIGFERVRTLVERGPLGEPEAFVNDFEEAIFRRLPRLGELREQLLREGATWARMSGSGSTIVGAFHEEDARERALRSFRDVRAVPAEIEN